MNLTAWVTSVIGSKYKLVEQNVDGDKLSNVLTIQQKYSVPKLRKKENVVKDFYRLNYSPEMIQDGLRIKANADGWCAADCSLFGVSIYVVTNGGYITYNNNHPSLLQG